MRTGLRPATQAEIEQIEAFSALDPSCTVLALDTPKGAILGVLRVVRELDPVFFPEGLDTRHKVLFARDIKNFLLGERTPYYFFNVKADDEQWKTELEKWGAEEISPWPETRYRVEVYRPEGMKDRPSGNQEKD